MFDMDELEELDPAQEGPDEREFAMILFGATGYLGQMVAQHIDALLSQPGAPPHKWAVAGRNLGLLREVARSCKTSPAVVTAEGPVEISAMAGRCRVLLNAAGPYAECGEAVISACVNQLTDYLDANGEVVWMHNMIEKYHAKAKDRGVMVVLSGAQSAHDVMVYQLVSRLGPLKQVRIYYYQYGAMSGGSVQTSICGLEAGADPDNFQMSRDPFCLGGKRAAGLRDVDGDCLVTSTDSLYPALWQIPASPAQIPERVVRRSCALFDERPSEGVSYGAELSVVVRDSSLSKREAEARCAGVLLESSQTAPAAQAVRQAVQCSQSPPPRMGAPSALRALHVTYAYAVAEAESGEWAHVYHEQPDCYEYCALSLVAGALALVEEREALRPRERGGLVTFAYALRGSSWERRLQEHGLGALAGRRKPLFEVRSGKPTEAELRAKMAERSKAAAQGMALISSGKVASWDRPELTALRMRS